MHFFITTPPSTLLHKEIYTLCNWWTVQLIFNDLVSLANRPSMELTFVTLNCNVLNNWKNDGFDCSVYFVHRNRVSCAFSDVLCWKGLMHDYHWKLVNENWKFFTIHDRQWTVQGWKLNFLNISWFRYISCWKIEFS